MFRKLAIFTFGALVMSSLAIITPAGATTAGTAAQVPDGQLSCVFGGESRLSPVLPVLSADASGKPGKLDLRKGVVESCNEFGDTGVTGGKVEITGGSLNVKAVTAPGSSCESLGDAAVSSVPPEPARPPLLQPSVNLTLTGRGPTGRPVTVAKLQLTNVTSAVSRQPRVILGAGTIEITGTVRGTPGRNPFAGRTVTVTMVPDNGAEVIGCMAGSPNPEVRNAADNFFTAFAPFGVTKTIAPLARIEYRPGQFFTPPSAISIR